MIRKNSKVIIKFDEKEYSKKEQNFLICNFFESLMKISAEQESKKFKTKKEQKFFEQEFIDFGTKVIKEVEKGLNNK